MYERCTDIYTNNSATHHQLNGLFTCSQELAEPFAELAKALDVDVVIGSTYYDS